MLIADGAVTLNFREAADSLSRFSDTITAETTMRNTQQKEAIRGAFEQADRPLSPDEVLALANKKVKRLSIATVYRNINLLVEDAFLSTVEVPGGASRYEIAGKEHHHHFQCDDCGKIYELEGCLVKDRPRLPRGFRSTRHEIFFYGLCAACA